jgi:hypothetical protein
MAKLITSNFRTHMAEQLYESVTESANTTYYAFAAKSTAWENDDVPEANGTSVRNTYYDMYDQMLFGKRLGKNDIRYMIKKNIWQSGTVYEPFNVETQDLDSKKFYVVVQENNTQSQTVDYSVFKCLNNAGGAASTVSPKRSEVTASDELYQTADGYQWKWMFTVPNAVYNKFATSLYIPIEPNANVQANAVSGSIEAYQVVDGGRDYNSYAKGYVKSGSVAGNTQFISLSGSNEVKLTLDNVTNLTFERVELSTSNATFGVISNIDSARNIVTLSGIQGAFQVGQSITNGNVTKTISLVQYEIDSLSANTDFYKNSSIYIRSGTGAGQLRTVEEYIVTGDERRVLLDSAFTTTLDSSSIFEITPRVKITGDGTGAEAIAIINEDQQNKIEKIEVVNKGLGYTFANVSIIANTGYVDVGGSGNTVLTSSANVTPLLAPKGGHGSDPVNELFGHRIGFSLEFDGSEGGTIPIDNSYRKIGIIKEPLFANVEFSIESNDGSVNPTSYSDGETVTQYNTRDSDIVLQTFVYALGRYEDVTVANGAVFSEGDTVYGFTDVADPDPSTLDIIGTVRSVDSNVVSILKNPNYATITFGNSDHMSTLDTVAEYDAAVTAAEIDGANPTQVISSSAATYNGTSVSISGSDNFGRTFGYKEANSDLPLGWNAFLNNLNIKYEDSTANSLTIGNEYEILTLGTTDWNAAAGTTGVTYSVGDTFTASTTGDGNGTVRYYLGNVSLTANSINLGTLSVSNSDIVYAYITSDTETFTADNLTTGATGEVSNRTATRLRLKNVEGTFSEGDTIVGALSGVKSTITNVFTSVATMDQRLSFTVDNVNEQTTGFYEGQEVTQTDTGAKGIIHSLNRDNGIVNRINLTEYKGTFNISDAFGNDEEIIASNGSTARLTARQKPSLEYGSGEIIYVETFRPIQRAATSTEKLKLIIEF